MIRRLLRLGVAATLAAGLVSALRQRHEKRVAEAGTGTGVGGDTGATPGPAYGPVAARLAEWSPPRPQTPAGRLAAALWAAPLTSAGVAVALASGARPRWDAEHGVLVAEGVRGPSRLGLGLVGSHANTIGQVVLSTREPTPGSLLAHEAVHVRQAERLGVAVFPLYLWLGARYGYRAHPLEQAPRAAAVASDEA